MEASVPREAGAGGRSCGSSAARIQIYKEAGSESDWTGHEPVITRRQ